MFAVFFELSQSSQEAKIPISSHSLQHLAWLKYIYNILKLYTRYSFIFITSLPD